MRRADRDIKILLSQGFFTGLPALLGVPLLLALIALWGPVIWRGQALFWGTPLLQFIPWWHTAWQAVLAGHLPLWNPLLGMGAPLLANYQTGLFYPPNWLYFILYLVGGTEIMAWGQAWLVAMHLAWTAAGMALLTRRLGLPAFGQAVSALAFGLSGYLVARAGFLSINAAAAWMPWILAFLTPGIDPQPGASGGLGKRLPPDFFKLVGCLTMQLLAGHAQTAWYTLLLAGLWSGYLNLASRTPQGGGTPSVRLQRLWRGWLGLGLALLLACGLGAAQLLPTLEYLGQSQRAEAVSYQLAMTYSLWPWRLLGLLAPGLFGSPVQGDYWGYANFWEDALYVGMLPFLLALGGALRGVWKGLSILVRRQQQKEAPRAEAVPLPVPELPAGLTGFCLVLFAVALVWGLGQNTPVFPWLYRHVPTFNLFQAPTRVMIWAEFSLALLAGIGAGRWRRPEGRALYWTRLGSAGAFAVALGAGLAWLLLGTAEGGDGLGLHPSFVRATALAGFWGLGAGLLSLVAPPRDGPGRTVNLTLWQCGVTLFIALDLTAAGWGLNPGGDLALFRPRSDTLIHQAGLSDQRLYFAPAEEYDLKYKRFLRFDTFDPGEAWVNLRLIALPNTNLLDGLAVISNFDPLVPGHYAAWVEELGRLAAEGRQRRLRFMGVGGIVQLAPEEPLGVKVLQLSGSSRVHWLPCGRLAETPQQAWLLLGEVDWARQVVLEATEPFPAELLQSPECELGQPDAQPDFSWREEGPNRIVIEVRNAQPGFLVLADTWYPGWQARLDGHRVPLWRANTAFRAIWLPEGATRVEFVYRPLSFYGGLGLSGLCTLALLVLGVRKARHPAAPRPSEGR